MRFRPSILLASACALAGSAASTVHAAPKGACSARLDKLERALGEIPDHVGFGVSPMPVMPPTSKVGTKVVDRGVIIDLNKDTFAIEGVRSEVGYEEFDVKASRIAEVERLIDRPDAPAYLRVDASTPLSIVMPLACKLAAKRDVHFVVRKEGAQHTGYSPKPPSEQVKAMITDIMQRPEPKDRARLMTQAFTQAVAPCDPLRSVVAAVDLMPPPTRTHFLERALVDGIRACDCQGLDVDTLESLVILMAAPISPPSYALAPNLPCGQAKPYGLSMDQPFGALIVRMTQ